AMILAEELECDFSKVKVEYASAHRNLVDHDVYQSMGTGGSSSVRRSRVLLQQAGASARERLIAAAATRWGVAPATCAAVGGLKSYDASKVAGRRGILAVLPVTNGIAVAADNFWRAKEALAALPVAWDF